MPHIVAYQKNVVYAFIKLSAKSHSFNILRTMDGLSCPTKVKFICLAQGTEICKTLSTSLKNASEAAGVLGKPQYVAYQKNVVYAFIKLSAKSHSFNILRTMDGLSCPTKVKFICLAQGTEICKTLSTSLKNASEAAGVLSICKHQCSKFWLSECPFAWGNQNMCRTT